MAHELSVRDILGLPNIKQMYFIFLYLFREFAKTIKRPFGLRYNPYTQTVDLLTNTRKIANIVSELKGDLCIVTNALSKLKVSESEAPNR